MRRGGDSSQRHPSISHQVQHKGGGYFDSPFILSLDVSSTSPLVPTSQQQHSTGIAKRPREEEDASASSSTVLRQWHRAGVGAGKLTAKDKLEQLRTVRDVYGDIAASSPTDTSSSSFAVLGDSNSNSGVSGIAQACDRELRRQVLPKQVQQRNVKPLSDASSGDVENKNELFGSVMVKSSSRKHEELVDSKGIVASEVSSVPDLQSKRPGTGTTTITMANNSSITTGSSNVSSKRRELEEKRLAALFPNKKKR